MKKTNKIKNLSADLLVIFALYSFYTRLPYFKGYFSGVHDVFFQFTTFDFLFWVLVAFLIFILPFRYFKKRQDRSKSLIFLSVLVQICSKIFQKEPTKIKKEDWVAFLSLLVRAFYFPLMANWCLFRLEDLISFSASLKILGLLDSRNLAEFFNKYLFWFLFNLLFFVDTFIFSVSYLLESKFLGNKIRSVEPTIFGWLVALACYPPINNLTGRFLSWETKDSVTDFSSQNVNLFFNVLIILALIIYAWASIALGFKAGNLVNRGIVDKGPYRFVRHPAYISKNFAWWMGSAPFLFLAWQNGWKELVLVLINVIFWSLIYYFRAITEERHLMRDPDYQKYVKKVKWRFIPKVF